MTERGLFHRARRKLYSLALACFILWLVYACWPMLALTTRGVRVIGIARTAEVYRLLAQVGHYNKVLNVEINDDRGDPFGPRIRQLEGRRAGGQLSAADESELGNLYLRLGRFEDAIAAFVRCLDAGSNSYSTYFDLALAYMRLGETDNCAHSPVSNTCLLPVALLHTERRGTARAAEMFERALEQKDTLEARWLLNLMHMLLGDHPQAVPEKYRMTPSFAG
ncbi:MAG: tetratricopeptide repeat protein, partial [Acidobacteria bacterium]|nr:tetratricopeptide repeat protein [Acidobacteriota bacterium]